MADDDDLNLPRAAINKLIKETLPHVRVSVEARELIVICCNEFIHLLSSESNDICNKQTKKTIMPEHVLDALKSLGFGQYVKECERVLDECKHVALKKRRGSSRLENLGIPEAELLRQQQELFAQARKQQFEQEQQEWLQHQQLLQQETHQQQLLQEAHQQQQQLLQQEAHHHQQQHPSQQHMVENSDEPRIVVLDDKPPQQQSTFPTPHYPNLHQ